MLRVNQGQKGCLEGKPSHISLYGAPSTFIYPVVDLVYQLYSDKCLYFYTTPGTKALDVISFWRAVAATTDSPFMSARDQTYLTTFFENQSSLTVLKESEQISPTSTLLHFFLSKFGLYSPRPSALHIIFFFFQCISI